MRFALGLLGLKSGGATSRGLLWSSVTRVLSAPTMQEAAAPSIPYVVCCENGVLLQGDGLETSKAFLTRFPRGAYTTARTVGRNAVFEFEAHVERVAQTAELMLGDKSPRYPSLVDPVRLRPRVLRCVGGCMARFYQQFPDEAGELKLTLLADWELDADDAFHLYCHGLPLPPLPKPPIIIEVRGAPRENALAKDSQWVSDRKGLEALKHPDSNEIVLPAADGALLEGTQTNFYAVVNGTLHTAGAGVLEGTVRRLVLEVCAAHGIPVSLTPPNVRDVSRWEGALISSTSRLALPVDEVLLPAEGRPVHSGTTPRHRLGTGGLAARVSALVAAEVAEHSTIVIGSAGSTDFDGTSGGAAAAGDDACTCGADSAGGSAADAKVGVAAAAAAGAETANVA
ncbi:unnamed protein product [Phaeothamnion confervicola]